MWKVLDKILWDAHGWVIIGLAVAALMAWLFTLISDAVGNGPMSGMIRAVTTFVGIIMVCIVVGTALNGILVVLLGW
jgi:VIT1/CCC1 family predicted Fe2+/Mn2+ transporter